MTFARWVFRLAGIYGLVVMGPQYFLEGQVGRDYPPPVTHPEFFYGFIGVALAWQVAFLIIGQDPVRFRPLMIPAVLEKFSFGLAAGILFFLGRTSLPVLVFGSIDLTLGVLFAVALVLTSPPEKTARP